MISLCRRGNILFSEKSSDIFDSGIKDNLWAEPKAGMEAFYNETDRNFYDIVKTSNAALIKGK